MNSLEPIYGSNDIDKSKYGMVMHIQCVMNTNELLASYENGDLALFSLDTFKELSRLTLFSGQPLLCFDHLNDNNFNIGVAGCSEAELKQFQINNSKLTIYNELISLKNAGLNFIKIRLNDAKIFSTAGWDSRVRVYSLKKAKLLCVLDFHKDTLNTLDFSAKNILACASNDGLISFWNLYNN